MIDRSTPVFLLRPRTLLAAAGISAALFSVLLLASLICWGAGWIAWGACWLALLLICIVGYGVVLALAGVMAGAAIAALKQVGSKEGGGCLAFILGIIALAILTGMWPWMTTLIETPRRVLVGNGIHVGWNEIALKQCVNTAISILDDIFFKYQIHIFSWTVLVTALVAALLTLLFLGILRTESALKAVLYKIRFRCKRCGQTLPRFRCPGAGCPIWHEDLRPTIFGLMKVRCQRCRTLLPTTDLGGRLRLPQSCGNPKCGDASDLLTGRVGEYHLAIAGAQSSGKSNYLFTAVWRFVEDFAVRNGLTLSFPDSRQQVEYDNLVASLRQGRAVPKTGSSERPMAFTLDLKSATGIHCRLYLYDAAGEDFEAGDIGARSHGLSGFDFQGYLDGLFFVVDPFAEELPQMQQSARAGDNPARFDSSFMMARLLPALERAQKVTTGRNKIPIPVAVVVTKADGCGLESRLVTPEVSGSYGSIERAAEQTKVDSDAVRGFLEEIGAADVVRLFESSFIDVRYFGVTALGRPADPQNNSPFTPRRVLEPLIWLGYRCHALTDVAPGTRAVANAVDFFRRSLRGQEGTGLKLSSWAIVITAYASLFGGGWYFGNVRLAVFCLVAAMIGPILVRRISRRGLQDWTEFRQGLVVFLHRFRLAFSGRRGRVEQRKAILLACGMLASLLAIIFLVVSTSAG